MLQVSRPRISLVLACVSSVCVCMCVCFSKLAVPFEDATSKQQLRRAHGCARAARTPAARASASSQCSRHCRDRQATRSAAADSSTTAAACHAHLARINRINQLRQAVRAVKHPAYTSISSIRQHTSAYVTWHASISCVELSARTNTQQLVFIVSLTRSDARATAPAPPFACSCCLKYRT